MSESLTPDEIDSITKSRQLRKQLEELREAGYWRARLGREGIILEREHYKAVCAGALPPTTVSAQTNRPKIRPIVHVEYLSTSVATHPVYEGLSPIDWLEKRKWEIIIPLAEIVAQSALWPAIQPHQTSGIYFLFRSGSLRYVGKALDVCSRLHRHKADGKRFDSWASISVPELLLDMVENAYISWLRPPENKRFQCQDCTLAIEARNLYGEQRL